MKWPESLNQITTDISFHLNYNTLLNMMFSLLPAKSNSTTRSSSSSRGNRLETGWSYNCLRLSCLLFSEEEIVSVLNFARLAPLRTEVKNVLTPSEDVSEVCMQTLSSHRTQPGTRLSDLTSLQHRPELEGLNIFRIVTPPTPILALVPICHFLYHSIFY